MHASDNSPLKSFTNSVRSYTLHRQVWRLPVAKAWCYERTPCSEWNTLVAAFILLLKVYPIYGECMDTYKWSREICHRYKMLLILFICKLSRYIALTNKLRYYGNHGSTWYRDSTRLKSALLHLVSGWTVHKSQGKTFDKCNAQFEK